MGSLPAISLNVTAPPLLITAAFLVRTGPKRYPICYPEPPPSDYETCNLLIKLVPRV